MGTILCLVTKSLILNFYLILFLVKKNFTLTFLIKDDSKKLSSSSLHNG